MTGLAHGPDDLLGRALSLMEIPTRAEVELAGAFRGGYDLVPHPRGEGLLRGERGLLDHGQFVVAQVDAPDVAPGVGGLGSAGGEGHSSESSGTIPDTSSAGLDKDELQRRFRSMETTLNDTTEEEWRAVPGYEGYYEVSNAGRVRSLRRRLRRETRLLTANLSSKYPAVTLSKDNVRSLRRVHSLVMAAFVGPRPEGMEVRHIDGNAFNPSLTNLAYGSRSENVLDQVRHGIHHVASKTHCIRNHEFTPDNTIVRVPGRRTCRTCYTAYQREYNQTRRVS